MAFPTLNQRLEVRQKPINRSPVMYQNWRDLLFLHWKFSPELIQKTLPEGLFVDTYEGNAYLGLVPFFMQNVRPRFFPSVPGISNFLEMNLRTYVYDSSGKPGVWFYSLDANQKLAVICARTFFNLPYFHAKMSANMSENTIRYKCKRLENSQNIDTEVSYSQKEKLKVFSQDSLEFFLIERYILFASDKNKNLYSGQVHHIPYPLYNPDYKIEKISALELAGFSQPKRPPDHAIMSPGVDVEIFSIQKI